MVRITGGKLSGCVVFVIKVADGLVISRSALRESPSFSALRRSLVNVNSKLDNDKTGPRLLSSAFCVSTCVCLCGREERNEQTTRKRERERGKECLEKDKKRSGIQYMNTNLKFMSS